MPPSSINSVYGNKTPSSYIFFFSLKEVTVSRYVRVLGSGLRIINKKILKLANFKLMHL